MLAAKAEAILDVWYPGTFGTIGIWELIFGDANPCGRVPMSFPHTTGQLPMSYSAFTTGRPIGDWTGFVPYASNYMDVPNVALYPFGFGLSYTEFELSDMAVTKDEKTVSVSLKVTNKGDADGDEVVQVYIGSNNKAIDRPVKGLKGFKRVSVKKGEAAEVTVKVDVDDIKFYCPESGKWTLDECYTVYVGTDSKNIIPAEKINF